MTEHTPDDRRDSGATGGSRADPHSDATQVVRPPAGGEDHPTTVSAMPLYPPAAWEQAAEPTSGGEAGQWPSAYSAQPSYESPPAVTSVYPPSTPGYAPSGYPAAYAPPVAVAPPASAVLVSGPSSRVGPGFLATLIGLLLSAGGVYLGAKFGAATATDIGGGTVGFKHSGLTVLGGLLLFAAVGLNGWSPWATIIPGIALTGIGGWTLFSVSGQDRVSGWVQSVVPEFATWTVVGFSLILGLVMLAASIAAALARAAGKKDGQIIGFRQI